MSEGRPERFSRGGCWSRPRSGVRVARRIIEDPDDRFESRGIRLVEVVDDSASKSTHPHIPRSHRFVRGGSWRFLGSKNDRKRVYPRFYTSENIGIRLVEVVDD